MRCIVYYYCILFLQTWWYRTKRKGLSFSHPWRPANPSTKTKREKATPAEDKEMETQNAGFKGNPEFDVDYKPLYIKAPFNVVSSVIVIM